MLCPSAKKNSAQKLSYTIQVYHEQTPMHGPGKVHSKQQQLLFRIPPPGERMIKIKLKHKTERLETGETRDSSYREYNIQSNHRQM